MTSLKDFEKIKQMMNDNNIRSVVLKVYVNGYYLKMAENIDSIGANSSYMHINDMNINWKTIKVINKYGIKLNNSVQIIFRNVLSK